MGGYLLSLPFRQKPDLYYLALRLQLTETVSYTFRYFTLAAQAEPVLPVLGHIPGARHGLAMHRQRIIAWNKGSQLIALLRTPALVPQPLVIGL